jgi:hypothetical protein
MRIFIAAVALCALSFTAGVVGDLSRATPANAGVSVTLRLPPELPADTVRAAPLPPLIATASAQASEMPQPRVRRAEPVVLVEETILPPLKPRADRLLHGPVEKLNGERTPKAKRPKTA